MKSVKCYGKAKVTTVDSSFKRNFFGSFDFINSNKNISFQKSQQKSSSFTSVASTSDCTDIHSLELFTSDAYSSDGSLPICSPYPSKNIGRKKKFVVPSARSKACLMKKKSLQSTSHSFVNVQVASTRKAKKPLKKRTRISKRCAKQRISKQIKPPVKVTALNPSHSDHGLSYRKETSKIIKHLKSYKKGTLKRNHKHSLKISRRHSLNKHSSIPIQPGCSYFCENPSSVICTGVKKTNKKGGGKKNQLINKDHNGTASYCFNMNMTPPLDSKHESFWVAIQPNWSSINEYSFEIEKASRKRGKITPKFIEQHANKNATFLDFNSKDNELLSNKENISGEIHVQSKESNSCKHHEVEKHMSSEFYIARNDSYLKLGNNFNVNSLETVVNKLKAAVCKKSDVIISTIIDQDHPKMDSADIQCAGDKGTSNLCETDSEKLNDNKNVSINKDENTSNGKSVEICRETAENKISNKDFITSLQSNFTAGKTVFENTNIFKRNKKYECLSENADQLQENASAMLLKESKGFYSSTPITSPSTYATIPKVFHFSRAFSPVLKNDLFATSTPTQSSKVVTCQQNQVCNANRISYLERRSSLLPGLSTDSYVNPQKYPSTKMNSSLLSRKDKSHIPFINNLSHSNQNACNRSSRSCILFSRREQSSLGESHCGLFKKALHSPVASTSSESNFNSTLSKLLGFCGQTSIIPFDKLYDWSHTTVRKIGEGTYGEVFTLVQKKISSVIKVIPFSEENGDHSMQSIEAVLSEVTVSQCLSELRNNKNYKTRNFNKLKSVHLVRGCYPDQMLDAWDKYSVARSTYNSRPDIFNDQQMFSVIELEYGGKDMTCFIPRNAVEGESILKQIAISLAIAEEAHLFEHRDLHLGNILVQRNCSKKISYVLGGKSFSIPNHGLVVTIIDFTLSRVLHEGCIFYNDIDDDDSLFDQTGDYQFQIYKDTKLLLNNEWHKCLLYSNVLWLTYLCVKLLECNYSRPSSKKHEESLKNIKKFQNSLRTCVNAFECLTTCNILASIPKNEQASIKKMAMKAKFVDRKSFQKSISRRTSNVE